jgi:catalase-peroxidase
MTHHDAHTPEVSTSETSDAAGKCPFSGHAPTGYPANGTRNTDWWPNQLDLRILQHNSPLADPMDPSFDYQAEFATVDLAELRADIEEVMTTSQDWWPADYGHYGPLFIRMAWHAAGTYRVGDGRGGAGAGMLRFAPLNSWPDNTNLDKARLLLWPVKQKWGRRVSWADLMVFAGNCALDSMGFKTFGFAGGRADVWEPEEDTYWGSEATWLADERYTGDRDLANPLAAVQMGLIYVNPEGPNGNPDPLLAARDIRETFGRMAMDDVETVALVAGGHTFGKSHGAASASHVGVEPEAAKLQAQATGWENSFSTGHGADTITSGLEGAWTSNPIAWDMNYLENLLNYDWELTTSPAGAKQWRPVAGAGATDVVDAHDPSKRHAPMMHTTDLALRFDPAYEQIVRRFLANPDEFADAFARAWFKLTHRDMGPISRSVGALVPPVQIWQDPVPARTLDLPTASDISELKRRVLASKLSTGELVATAWASAASFRATDKRGGANGARIRLAPQRDWAANNPERTARVLSVLEQIRDEYNTEHRDSREVSLADLIVLAGTAAVEHAARTAGHEIDVEFHPGRTDATEQHTDAASFAHLEPTFDGFRNYIAPGHVVPAEKLLLERARLLSLTAPEMTALVGGLRVLGANHDHSHTGVFTDRVGELTNDFFVNLLDLSTKWHEQDETEEYFEGRDRRTGELRWHGSRVDLVFGSNSQLRALAEVFGSRDGEAKLVRDFARAWSKVMHLDRFDLR